VPADADCLLLPDSVVPWDPENFEPSPEARIIRLDLDPIVSMTPIYFEFPCDLLMSLFHFFGNLLVVLRGEFGRFVGDFRTRFAQRLLRFAPCGAENRIFHRFDFGGLGFVGFVVACNAIDVIPALFDRGAHGTQKDQIQQREK